MKTSDEWPDVEPVERTKIDEWFNDLETPPLSLRDAMILGMVQLSRPITLSYDETE